jgi:hypothetical protein
VDWPREPVVGLLLGRQANAGGGTGLPSGLAAWPAPFACLKEADVDTVALHCNRDMHMSLS